MTLKEKFRMANMVDNGSTILEKYQAIADEFAIEFAIWYNEILADDEYKIEKSKELLEIYKKEKGL